jgi:hypothetical protein
LSTGSRAMSSMSSISSMAMSERKTVKPAWNWIGEAQACEGVRVLAIALMQAPSLPKSQDWASQFGNSKFDNISFFDSFIFYITRSTLQPCEKGREGQSNVGRLISLRAGSHYGHPSREAVRSIEWPNSVESPKKWAENSQ